MKTNEDQAAWRRLQTPTSIRNEGFSRRLRGLDEDEVRDYLDLLADQVQGSDRERDEMRAELEQLRTDNERLQAELRQLRSELADHDPVEDRVNDQVVELFSQAQLVAEEMVEEVSREARQRLGQARAQERQILEEAMQTAQRTLREAETRAQRSPALTGLPSALAPAAGNADQVRSFAQQAQAQMQSIMEAFAAQVERLDAPRATGLDTWGTA